MPPALGNIEPSSVYVRAIVSATAAPMTQARMAAGPAMAAARSAPKSQPEPMIDPRPVAVRAMVPRDRR